MTTFILEPFDSQEVGAGVQRVPWTPHPASHSDTLKSGEITWTQCYYLTYGLYLGFTRFHLLSLSLVCVSSSVTFNSMYRTTGATIQTQNCLIITEKLLCHPYWWHPAPHSNSQLPVILYHYNCITSRMFYA